MGFCSSCGASIGDAAFCNSCGAAQGASGASGGAASAPNDNLCVRCGANLQNGVCLACGWTAPVAAPAPAAPAMAAAPAAAPVNVIVNAGQNAAPTGATSGPPCPKCQSTNTELTKIVSEKSAARTAAKVTAGIMTLGISTLATGVTSKAKREFKCGSCGFKFKTKW